MPRVDARLSLLLATAACAAPPPGGVPDPERAATSATGTGALAADWAEELGLRLDAKAQAFHAVDGGFLATVRAAPAGGRERAHRPRRRVLADRVERVGPAGDGGTGRSDAERSGNIACTRPVSRRRPLARRPPCRPGALGCPGRPGGERGSPSNAHKGLRTRVAAGLRTCV
mgnify:CR=1 FL=1